jgi:hypothetical protein
VIFDPELSTVNVPKYSPRDVRNSTCTFEPPPEARALVIDVIRIVGSRNCASPSGVVEPPSVEYAVASSPCATASRNFRTSDSAGDAAATAGAAVGATVGDGVRAARVGRAVGVRAGCTVGVAVGGGDAFAVRTALGVALGLDVGDAVGLGVAFVVAVARTVGVAVARAVAVVSCATVAIGVGVCITTSGELRCAGAGECRAANAESNAPIPKPAMITPAKSGTIGNPPRSSSSFEGRRRRGEPDRELMFSQRSTRKGLALDGRTRAGAKRTPA